MMMMRTRAGIITWIRTALEVSLSGWILEGEVMRLCRIMIAELAGTVGNHPAAVMLRLVVRRR
jgi:hypothetical protein